VENDRAPKEIGSKPLFLWRPFLKCYCRNNRDLDICIFYSVYGVDTNEKRIRFFYFCPNCEE